MVWDAPRQASALSYRVRNAASTLLVGGLGMAAMLGMFGPLFPTHRAPNILNLKFRSESLWSHVFLIEFSVIS